MIAGDTDESAASAAVERLIDSFINQGLSVNESVDDAVANDGFSIYQSDE